MSTFKTPCIYKVLFYNLHNRLINLDSKYSNFLVNVVEHYKLFVYKPISCSTRRKEVAYQLTGPFLQNKQFWLVDIIILYDYYSNYMLTNSDS